MLGQTNWTLVASLGGSPGINSQDADADVDASLIGLTKHQAGEILTGSSSFKKQDR